MSAKLPTLALAEDNADDVFFMKRAMAAAGIANPLEILGDGRQVLEYFEGKGRYADRDAHPLPRLLLLDLKLPLMSGFQVLEWLRGRPMARVMPIIVLTSSGQAKDINRAYELGANSYLIKPSGGENLLNQMKAIKFYWLDQNVFEGQ
jgi:DNA-binding response OmpR family regulator